MSENNITKHDDDRIAVIGMACRLPGDIDSPAALWRSLVERRDAVVRPLPGRAGGGWAESQEWGGYLRDLTGFDADFFGVSRHEADVLDPQHRLLLEVSWEALEHSGLPPAGLAGTSTGLFAGMSYNDYAEHLVAVGHESEGSALTN